MTLRARVVRRPQSIHASSVELVCSLRVFWVLGCPLVITLGLDIFASQPATVQRASQATESGRVPCTPGLKRHEIRLAARLGGPRDMIGVGLQVEYGRDSLLQKSFFVTVWCDEQGVISINPCTAVRATRCLNTHVKNTHTQSKFFHGTARTLRTVLWLVGKRRQGQGPFQMSDVTSVAPEASVAEEN